MSVRSPLVLAHWRSIFADHRRSGLSITAFCKSRKLVKSSFHRWRNTLEQLDRPVAESERKPAFVPLRVVPETVALTMIDVILPSGIQLRVPLGSDASQVASLAQALVGANRC